MTVPELTRIIAGNRWHIDCFRCNTCGTLLDSDANLLLLGDGSLICNNCTYSCSACGNKIEDLAILTGEQAFCASCFKCRNCKKEIENLRYARTSQGIFCMECHEGLMARRRKKGAKSSSSRHKQVSNNNTMLLDKSLPSLPPNAIFPPDGQKTPSDTYSETPTELPTPQSIKRSAKSRAAARERSPAALEQDSNSEGISSRHIETRNGSYATDNLTLPSTTYKNNRHSAISQRSDLSGNGDDYYIPMALDPNTAPGPSPLTRLHRFDSSESASKHSVNDYVNLKASQSSSRTASHDYEGASTVSKEATRRGSHGSSQPSSPHIAYQEKGRTPSSDMLDTIRKRSLSGITNPLGNSAAFDQEHREDVKKGQSEKELFKLQEAPKRRKSGSSARNSRSEAPTPASVDTNVTDSKSKSAPVSATTEIREQQIVMKSRDSPGPPYSDSTFTISPRHGQDKRAQENGSKDSPSSQYSPPPPNTQIPNLPQRGDSLLKSVTRQSPVSRKEVVAPPKVSTSSTDSSSAAPTSASSHESPLSSTNLNGGRTISRPMESPIKSGIDLIQPPARSKDRPMLATTTPKDAFVSPRPPPHPPAENHQNHKSKNESISTLQSESTRNGDQPASPTLPRYSAGGEFSMVEEMTRILGNDEPDQASFLRRVSNSVRHARSHSDRGHRLSKEKWPRSPLHSSSAYPLDISSPIMSSPDMKDDITRLKTELRMERQRALEKDIRISELESAVESRANIKQMNTELREKRSTIVVLDTQKEIVVRELEVLTDHIAAAKSSQKPLDLGDLTNMMLREFAEELQKLKDSFAPQIEDLTVKRNNLQEEVARLTQEKDKEFECFEQLSLKNAQLAEFNNSMAQQIEGISKQNKDPSLETMRSGSHGLHGLGIYTHHPKDKSFDSRDARPSLTDSQLTGSTLTHDPDAEPATILTAPQVVNIRKGQPKRFNWKKGGHTVAKGVTKGIKGAFTSNEGAKFQVQDGLTEGTPYGAMPQSSEYPTTIVGPPRSTSTDPSRQGFGFFGNQKTTKLGQQMPMKMTPNGSTATVVVENASGMRFCLVSRRNPS